MSHYANFADQRIARASVTIPTYGLWSADVDFAEAGSLPATGTLTIGDLQLVGYVHRTGVHAGQRSARLAAGYGGWRKQVPAQAYHLPLGIPLAVVLADVAARTGERVNLTDQPGVIGGYFFREPDVAQRVLRRVAGPVWYVDTDGTTRLRERPSDAITSPFLLTAYDPAPGRAVIATEQLSDWLPGRTFSAPQFDGTRAIQSTTIRVDNDGTLRLECLVRDAGASAEDFPGQPTSDDRLLASLRQIIHGELPSGVRNDGSALILDGGTGTSEHVATVEGVVNIVWQTFVALAATIPANWTGTNVSASIVVALETALLAASSTPVEQFQPAIEAAMLIKRLAGDDNSGGQPGLGCAEIFAG